MAQRPWLKPFYSLAVNLTAIVVLTAVIAILEWWLSSPDYIMYLATSTLQRVHKMKEEKPLLQAYPTWQPAS